MPVGDRRSAVACRLREWRYAGFAGLRPAVPVSAPHATMQSDAQARERRPLVGTARRRRAAGKDPEWPRRHEKVVRHSRRQSSALSAQVSRSRACRAPPGGLPRGRRSLACGQHCRSGGPHREHWRRSFATGVLWRRYAAEREKRNGSELRSLPSISGESVKGGYPLSQSVMTNRNLPPRACGAQGSFDFRREAPGGPWTGPRRNRT